MRNINKIILPLVFSIGCTMSFSANAIEMNSTTSIARNTVLDGAFQSKLRSILSPQDFNNFNSNLDDFSPPYTLKSGATYYEATKSGLSAGSAIVVDPKGFYYVAYKLPNNNQIVYVTNDKNCNTEPHDAIKVFSHKFTNNPTIISSKSMSVNPISHSCNGVYGNQKIKKNLGMRSITTYASGETTEQQMTRSSAESIWGSSVTNNWEMNDDLAAVVGQAVNEIRTCSANFNLVPKPPAYGTIPGLLYFAKYGLQVVRYNSGLQSNLTYKACIVTAAVNYRSAAEMASLGI